MFLQIDASASRAVAHADAFTKRGDDIDLFIARENVHGANPCGCGLAGSGLWKEGAFWAISTEAVIAQGANPGW